MAATTRPPDRADAAGGLLAALRPGRASGALDQRHPLPDPGRHRRHPLPRTAQAPHRAAGPRRGHPCVHRPGAARSRSSLALCGSWGRALRADLRRFNRWTKDDRAWLRGPLSAPDRSGICACRHIRVGKFNAGQKLNAAFIAGAGLVMLGTGVIMRWYHPWPLNWRTGATFVHDWLALAVGLVIIGHIGMALRDRDALRAMVVGHHQPCLGQAARPGLARRRRTAGRRTETQRR